MDTEADEDSIIELGLQPRVIYGNTKLASTAKHNEWSGYKNKKQSRCRRIKKIGL